MIFIYFSPFFSMLKALAISQKDKRINTLEQATGLNNKSREIIAEGTKENKNVGSQQYPSYKV